MAAMDDDKFVEAQVLHRDAHRGRQVGRLTAFPLEADSALTALESW
jgi:hypothetical protein